MKKVVVTGGAGFIGSHLAEELVRRGYCVTILDDLSTGKSENMESLLSSPSPSLAEGEESPGDAEFVLGSIADLDLLQRLFRGAYYVFHQAAIPSVPRSIDAPLDSHEVNATGTLNVLLAARDNGVKKVIYASSSSVYGDTPHLPKREDMPPHPQSPYAVAKLSGEYYCTVFQQIYGLPTVCLRYFNVYGPRQDPDSAYAAVIPRFISMVARAIPPPIFGDGEQTRDFTVVKDVVEANILAAQSSASGIFNIGAGKRITVNQLASLIINITGKDTKPVHRDARPGDIGHSLADVTRARAFGYHPKYDIEEGLKETIRSFPV